MAEEKKVSRKQSRREFLKGAAFTAVGTVAAVSLSGCGTEEKPASSGTPVSLPKEITTQVPEPVYEVYETDILVIGGGPGGCFAALEANALGANAILVDKGPFGFSGGLSCLHWGAGILETTPENTDAFFQSQVINENGLINQKALKARNVTLTNHLTTLIDHGTASYMRLADGNLLMYDSSSGRRAFGYFSRYDADVTQWEGVRVFERTMITNLLVNEGNCVGAVGIDIPTGTMRVFRAKKTIAAPSGFQWAWGWGSVSAYTGNPPDNTGDLDAIMYRLGYPIQDAEMRDITLGILEPQGLLVSQHCPGAWDGMKDYVCGK